MATRCYIGKINDDGSITYIYCHNDGYPPQRGAYPHFEGVGDFLLKYYGDEEDVDKLLALGDISTLGKTPVSGGYEAWKTYTDDSKCRTYRDRGDPDVDAKTAKNVYELINLDAVSYIYLFADDEWFWLEGFSSANEVRRLADSSVVKVIDRKRVTL